jgi:transcriptional regulator with XRE-family HTH domain
MIPNSIQIRAARALLGWSLDELAERSKVARSTIQRLEDVENVSKINVDSALRVKEALQDAGVIFIWPGARRGEGVRMDRHGPGFLRPERLTDLDVPPRED